MNRKQLISVLITSAVVTVAIKVVDYAMYSLNYTGAAYFWILAIVAIIAGAISLGKMSLVLSKTMAGVISGFSFVVMFMLLNGISRLSPSITRHDFAWTLTIFALYAVALMLGLATSSKFVVKPAK